MYLVGSQMPARRHVGWYLGWYLGVMETKTAISCNSCSVGLPSYLPINSFFSNQPFNTLSTLYSLNLTCLAPCSAGSASECLGVGVRPSLEEANTMAALDCDSATITACSLGDTRLR